MEQAVVQPLSSGWPHPATLTTRTLNSVCDTNLRVFEVRGAAARDYTISFSPYRVPNDVMLYETKDEMDAQGSI